MIGTVAQPGAPPRRNTCTYRTKVAYQQIGTTALPHRQIAAPNICQTPVPFAEMLYITTPGD
ncbi:MULTISPECIES: hypothetical protein [Mycolicibacterium]|uniref:hypothetical protein n=1 Tax=Mycolicibacterium TaxID=1866885 RepID=UPI000F9F44E1|nr:MULTISPECIES: hypothetical protein [Mycolicibacterium]RUP29790.1 MAG: hypothetical protein EKK51_19020 [Mycolicibacterium sp.]UCZ58156.1 hypothetical protein LHJ73_15215 [Mycolicibacterium phocaicum]